MDISDNNVLAKIKMLYQQKGWSVYRLAKESGLAYSSLNNMIQRNTQPSIPTLRKICNGLGISLSEFFEDDLPLTDLKYRLQLSESEFQLVENFRHLKGDDHRLLLAYLQGLGKKSL